MAHDKEKTPTNFGGLKWSIGVNWKTVRDIVLFVAGLAGVAHQTLIASSPSEPLLILFAAMMGLPAFLHSDERNGK